MNHQLGHPVPSTNMGVVCMIVPEVLKGNNYESWRIFMQHYFVAQDLLDVVLSSEMPLGEDPGDWIKKNALALHAMKISCGAEMFDKIKEMNSAKDAWNALADLHKQTNEDGSNRSETGIEILEREHAKTLLKDIKKGDSDAVKKLLETHLPYSAALENGSTALHVAIATGKIELAKELISVMSEGELETQDKSGRTALSLAACKTKKLLEIVKYLVEKNKKLLEIPDCGQKIPLVLACAAGSKSLTRYLFSETCTKYPELLDPVNGDHGFYLLKECISNHMFDIGLQLLRKFPDLTFHKNSIIVSVLVEEQSLLFGGRRPFSLVLVEELYLRFGWRRLRPPHNDDSARGMVHFICEKVSSLNREQLMRSGVVEATFKAIKLGCLDFVIQITETNPDIVWSLDPEHSRDMLMYAVAYRQRNIAIFLYHKLDMWRDTAAFTIDKDHNNMLHLAAKLVPSCPRIFISDPVLQLQNEAMWFKEVEGLVPQLCKEERNKDGETPSEVFSREHQGLLKEAQTWVKDTANFAAIIGTLIVGVMFAANITVPGGNNDRDGLPIFLKRSSFQIFLGSDGASLFFASLSVLLFLDIHKSSLTEEDFLTGHLNTKMALGFYLLFWSIGTMLICSLASIRLVDREDSLAMYIIGAALLSCPFIWIFIKQIRPFLSTFYFFYFRGLKAPRAVFKSLL